MVQQLGEGSVIPNNPQHTPTIIQPSSSQPQKIQKPRKPTRKDTRVPQPSGPTKSVTDEVVHKELGDKLVRAATNASSLEAKQDNGLREYLNNPMIHWSQEGRRIDVIDADEDITLVSAADNEMFDVDVLGGDEVFVAGQNENVVKDVVDAAQVSIVDY
nr:hypothetical protein [Tanacetum cinerariifolium]